MARRQEMLDFALAYARRGRHVFPAYEPSGASCACGNRRCQKPAKHPRTRRGFLDATVDEEVIREWYTRWPRANIGIATEPSGLIVLDVDPRHGGDESLYLLCSEHSAFDAPVVLTGGGGSHHYFAASMATATRPNALGQAYPGIDVCARHGNVIVPPSRHISGRLYHWEVSSTNELMPVPGWLAKMLAQHERTPIPGVDDDSLVICGNRNAALTRYAGRLRRLGTRVDVIEHTLLALNARQVHPPLPRDEVCTIARSVARYPAKM